MIKKVWTPWHYSLKITFKGSHSFKVSASFSPVLLCNTTPTTIYKSFGFTTIIISQGLVLYIILTTVTLWRISLTSMQLCFNQASDYYHLLWVFIVCGVPIKLIHRSLIKKVVFTALSSNSSGSDIYGAFQNMICVQTFLLEPSKFKASKKVSMQACFYHHYCFGYL